MSSIFAIFMAGVAGAAMALQGTFNTAAGKVIGYGENTLLVHGVGFVVIAILLFLFGAGRGDWGRIGEIPWYGYLGGVLSAVIIFAVIYSMSKLGVGNATAIIVLVQLGTALLIDSFGLFGAEKIDFAWVRFLGMGLLVVGAKLVFFRV